jgi:hypothetical protein
LRDVEGYWKEMGTTNHAGYCRNVATERISQSAVRLGYQTVIVRLPGRHLEARCEFLKLRMPDVDVDLAPVGGVGVGVAATATGCRSPSCGLRGVWYLRGSGWPEAAEARRARPGAGPAGGRPEGPEGVAATTPPLGPDTGAPALAKALVGA